jgi:hypothetical protein
VRTHDLDERLRSVTDPVGRVTTLAQQGKFGSELIFSAYTRTGKPLTT